MLLGGKQYFCHVINLFVHFMYLSTHGHDALHHPNLILIYFSILLLFTTLIFFLMQVTIRDSVRLHIMMTKEAIGAKKVVSVVGGSMGE